MRIIARRPLIDFSKQHKDAQGHLEAWWYETKHAKWTSPLDIKKQYGSASILGDNRVVFNISGDKYRLVVKINYHAGIVFIRFIGTHKEYDKINAEEI